MHLGDAHQLLWTVVRQRPQQHSVQHRENGGRRADAECKSEERGGSEGRLAPQRSKGVAEIGPHGGSIDPPSPLGPWSASAGKPASLADPYRVSTGKPAAIFSAGTA